jgi:hypothetical protein
MGPFSSLQDGFGFASVASPNMVYTAGVGGDVNQIDPTVSNYPDTFVSVASGQSLSPGAIAADGSLVVATIASPCSFTNLCPGSLARVVPGPSLKWSFPVGAITPPVIGRQGYIYVGVQISAATNSTPYQGAIQAYDQNGHQVWTTNLDPGLYATDVIIGNDGLVYAVASDAPYQTYSSQGEMIELDQNTGQKKLTVTDLPGASELILFNGVAYVTGVNITAIPVAASGYDAQAPWPVRFHDNQRTANAMAPQNLGNTQVADQTRDNSLYAELGAASNIFSGSLTATSFIGDGSGLTNVNAINANHATSADAANNAFSLGGVSATNYARLDIGNAFSGNQNVTGTLTASAGVFGQGTCSGGSCTAGVTGQGYFGLLGTGSVYGAYTTANSGPGIHAESSSDAGVFGKGVIGVSGLTQNSAGIAGTFNAYNGAKILSGLNSGTEVFSVDTYGKLTSSGFSVPPAGTASGTNTGFNSGAFDQAASVYNGSTAVAETFRWQVEPTNQGTPSAAASMHLLFGATSAPTETGLSIKPDGTIGFAPGQTFPGAGGITGVTAGAGLSGGGTIGNINIGIPSGAVSNAMLVNPSLNVSAGAGLTGGGMVPLGGTTSLSLAPQTCAGGSAVTAHPFTCSPFAGLGANTFAGAQTMPGLTVSGGGVFGAPNYVGYAVVGNGAYGGVVGNSTNSAGVFGTSSSNTAVLGENAPGTTLQPFTGVGGPIGVEGTTSNPIGYGVFGFSTSNVAVYGCVGSLTACEPNTTPTNAAGVFNNSGGGNILLGQNNGTNEFTVDAQGDVTANGNISAGKSITIGAGGTPIMEYVSTTYSATLPVLTAASCTTFTTAALTGFTPGTSDTIALGLPKSLVSALGNNIFLIYQAWETTTSASPTLTIQICNPTGSRYSGGATGTIRIDVFKH